MARIDLTMPKMGESVAEATLVKWCKNIGDRVEMDETILEIATDKVDSEVPSPKAGILVEKLYPEEAVVQVGAVFGILETDIFHSNGHETPTGDPVLAPNQSSMDTQSSISEELLGSIPGMNILLSEGSEKKPDLSAHAQYNSTNFLTQEDRFYSPLVREIARKEGLTKSELDQIKGSGLEGRVTKKDILDFVESRQGSAPVQDHSPIINPVFNSELPVSENPVSSLNTQPIKEREGDEIIVMDRMRRLISEHMVMSKNVSAHVTSFVEADVTNLVIWREKIKKEFLNREKENITYTPIFIEAVAKVLKTLPMVNVSVDGNSILVHKHINIGMATALPSGNLIVPVVKDADLMSLVGITKKVNDLASRARAGKLNPDDTSGGTFTLTNVGTFGNLMGTPIINQPQVAILATGAIVKKPAVLETQYGDVIAIRHKLFLSLSYDHRVVDGALGGTFLRKVADELESFDVNRTI